MADLCRRIGRPAGHSRSLNLAQPVLPLAILNATFHALMASMARNSIRKPSVRWLACRVAIFLRASPLRPMTMICTRFDFSICPPTLYDLGQDNFKNNCNENCSRDGWQEIDVAEKPGSD